MSLYSPIFPVIASQCPHWRGNLVETHGIPTGLTVLGMTREGSAGYGSPWCTDTFYSTRCLRFL